MTSPAEHQCIAKARAVKLRVAQEALADFMVKEAPFKSPVGECAVKIDWSNSLAGKVKQVAVLPISFAFVLLGILLTPIAYAEHLREVAKKKSALREKIQRLSTETLSFDVPDDKNIERCGGFMALRGMSTRQIRDSTFSVGGLTFSTAQAALKPISYVKGCMNLSLSALQTVSIIWIFHASSSCRQWIA